MAERPDHAERMAAGSPGSPQARERELAALRRLYDVARRRYGQWPALDAALDAVEEAMR